MAYDTFGEGSTYLSITKKDGTDMDFKTIIETIDISGGAKGFDSIASIAGGRLKKFNPQEDIEVTLEGYAVEIGSTNSTGKGFHDLLHTQDTSQPLSVPTDHSHSEYQIVILATDNLSQTNATSATESGDNAIRYTFKNGHFINVNPSFTDGVWKFTVTFKVPPFNKAGSSNITYESTDGTEGEILSEIDSYTSS